MRKGAAALAAVALAGCPAPRASLGPVPIQLAPAEHHEEAALAGVVHVVKRGETLYRIARAYGIDPADLMETNGISDPRFVPVGAEIFVPGAAHLVEVTPQPSGESAAEGDAIMNATSTTPPAANSTSTPPPTPSSSPSAEPGEKARGGGPSTIATPSATPAPPSTAAWRARSGEAPLAWPLRGVLYGRYGVRDGRRHDGLDIAAPEGATVSAAAAGIVIYAGEQAGYGAIVIIRHDAGLVTLYAHNSAILVSEGDHVARGEPVARVGQTGRTSGPHLHFEVREGTRPRNPLLFLP